MREGVVIAGGGIAGLTLALLLARQGQPSRIFERTETFSEAGAGLQLGPNAGRILDALGLGPALDAVATRPEALRFMDGCTGRHLNTLPLGSAAETRWGAPYRSIHRADFQHILLEAAGREPLIEIHMGLNIEHISTGADNVKITCRTIPTAVIPAKAGCPLEEDMHVLTTPFLFGADGMWSATRRALGFPPPRFSGQVAWRAMISADACPLPWAVRETGLWFGPKAHVVHYPVRAGNMINLVVVTAGEEAAQDTPLIPPFCADLQALLGTVSQWTSWPLYAGPANWGSGRVMLLGDAAHPMLPHLAQGAAQAIEDAAVLAEYLSGNITDKGNVLNRYARRRSTRINQVMRASRQNGQMAQMPGLGRIIRNHILSRKSQENLLKNLDWLYTKEDR